MVTVIGRRLSVPVSGGIRHQDQCWEDFSPSGVDRGQRGKFTAAYRGWVPVKIFLFLPGDLGRLVSLGD